MGTIKEAAEEKMYLELARILEISTTSSTGNIEYAKADKVLNKFKEYRQNQNDHLSKEWDYAQKVIERIANSEVISVLISDLKGNDAGRKKQAYEFVKKLADCTIGALPNLIKETGDLHLRKMLVVAMKHLEISSVEKLLNELTSSSPKQSRRIASVLSEIGQGDVLIQNLRKLFPTYSISVKKEILHTLFNMKTTPALEFLIELTAKPPLVIQQEAISLIGKLKYDRGMLLLMEISQFGLANGKRIHKLVRLEAIRALGNFSLNPVKEILRRLCEDEDKMIKQAAYETIQKQEVLVQQKADRFSHSYL